MPLRTKAAFISLFIAALACSWISGGRVATVLGSPQSGRSSPESGERWAFEPLREVTVPAGRDDGWCRTPIDRFIRARLEAAGIRPNPLADRRKLIRRAYFDLLGLPPSPEEVEQFVNDPSTTAYERLLERLLNNPHFGERWGRHWLDLARFAESHGYEQDYDRPNAYHFRDFVIKAFNQDMPYDQFVKWQIAGDEFAPNDPLALMATGFLAAGTHATQITANQAEKERYDELDDMIRTIGTSMLGLTISCARCHDHKFDPIPASDYYSLIATFSTTVRSDFEVDLEPERYLQSKREYDAAHAPLVAELERFEREELPGRFESYRAANAKLERSPWVLLEPGEVKSSGGATFSPLGDGSHLVSGANPDRDTYTLKVRSGVSGIRAIRLEAMADGSLPKGGPGRAPNGNFGLSDIRVAALADASPGDAAPLPIKIVRARSTFDQAGLPVLHAIDDNKETCWAVDPQFGKDHAAVFELEAPIPAEAGTTLAMTLDFHCNKQHGIGRPRLSVTAVEDAAIEGEPLTERSAQALAMLDADPTAPLNDDQRRAVLDWYRTKDAEWQRLHSIVQEHAAAAPKPKLAKVLISSEGVPAVRLHTQGLDFYDPTYHLKRGDPNQKGEVATQGFLTRLVRAPDAQRWIEPPPAGSRTSYRRRALANWLVDVDAGAGQLLARVIVNRLWYYHFGQGIVATPSDFGKQGEKPTHPELLDWLARELIDHDWRLSHIHKLIMTSAVYMQSNAVDDVRLAADRANKLHWRWTGRRLEAELIRDWMLAVGGRLDRTPFGPGTLDPKHRRRSIYFFVKRSQLVPMLTLFDGPDTLQDLPCRSSTTVAPQALLLMNNELVRDSAAGMAERLHAVAADAESFIDQAFQLALARPASRDERAAAESFLADQTRAYQQAGRENSAELARIDLCQAMLCLNEFVYVE